MERLEKMSTEELVVELHALYGERRSITNNYSGWSHPDTQAQSQKVFNQLSNEIDFINKRLDELGYFD